MIPELTFIRPASLAEALDMLKNNRGEMRPIAGGTDVIPGFQQGSSRFAGVNSLLELNNIAELKKMEWKDGELHLGAAVTFDEIENSEILRKHFPLLVKAASTIGSKQIRNRATVAGNFVNNAPCADSVTPLLIYNARIEIRSDSDSRIVPLEDLLLKPYKTVLKPNELVTTVFLPELAGDYEGDFYKLGRRRAVAISRVTLAVLGKTENGVFKDFRLSGGAVTPIGKRFYELEKLPLGQKPSSGLFLSLAGKIGEEILKTTGKRWSTPYKLPVIQRTFYNLLEKVWPV